MGAIGCFVTLKKFQGNIGAAQFISRGISWGFVVADVSLRVVASRSSSANAKGLKTGV
jgi:hypothetical protein